MSKKMTAQNWQDEYFKALARERKLVEALNTLRNSFIHTEGNIKGNKAKTDIIKLNPDVRDALNNARQTMWDLEK